jgi:hypothetical protein
LVLVDFQNDPKSVANVRQCVLHCVSLRDEFWKDGAGDGEAALRLRIRYNRNPIS